MNVMTVNFCHRDFPINYGQTLLGYALYRAIEKMGHNPIAVSYTERNQNIKSWYLTRLLTPDKRTFASKSFAKTTEFIRKNMTLVPCFSKEDVYEVAELCNAWVMGGDVVWRKGYLGEMFTLDFGSPRVRRISYSPSMYGWSEEDENFFKCEFAKIKRNFDYVSFREAASTELFSRFTGAKNVFNAIDPIFLETQEEWSQIAKPLKNVGRDYILIYIFGKPSEYENLIEQVRTEYNNKQLVIIPTTEEWAQIYNVTNPIGVEEFIWLFGNASAVITNSFHGVAFSVELNKQFYTCNRTNMAGEGKDFRISELLNRLGIKGDRDFLGHNTETIDYTEISPQVNEWREQSIEYLRTALSEPTQKKYPQVYAAKHKNTNIRDKSSSGGAFYAFAEETINEGGVVFGAEWDENFEVRHTCIESIEELPKLMRSKYVQSRLEDSYKIAESYLRKGRKVFFTGTPCQILGLRRYLNNNYTENLVCGGIICHGVPKIEEWREYLNSLEKRYGKTKEIIFRDKSDSWKNWNIKMEFEKESYLDKWQENSYYKRFLENKSLLDSCFSCNAKKHLQNLDLIMGDFWRYEAKEHEFDDDKGISAVVILSEEGEKLWNKVQDKFYIEQSDYETLSKLQWHLEHSAVRTE